MLAGEAPQSQKVQAASGFPPGSPVSSHSANMSTSGQLEALHHPPRCERAGGGTACTCVYN